MKTLIGALLAATALCGTALAADAIYVPPPEDVVFEEGPSPTVYFGIHGGWGWGFADHDPAAPVGPGGNGYDLALEGWLLGGQAGVNIPISDTGLFIGFEVDGSWSDIGGAEDFGGPVDLITHDIDWMASARGKLGFDAMGFRPYVTGGLAAAQITRFSSGGGDTDTNIQTGYTVGAGVDVPVAEMVSLNFEYRFSDFGYADFDTGGSIPSVGTTVHTVRAGINLEF